MVTFPIFGMDMAPIQLTMFVIQTADPDASVSRVSERSGHVAQLLIKLGVFSQEEYMTNLGEAEVDSLIKGIQGELD